MSSSAIRRLVLDISPWAWAFGLLTILGNLPMLDIWVSQGPIFPTMGLIFGLGGSILSQPKIAVWQLLPVTRREIDRARWWHAPGAGLIALPLLMVLVALVRVLQGRPHISWDQIALGSLAQIGICAIFASFVAWTPWVTRTMRRWSAIVFLLFIVLTFGMTMWPQDPAAARRMLPVLAIVGLPVALALYLAAGRWPMPLASGSWLTVTAAGKDRDIPSAAHRRKGWAAIAAGARPMMAACWGLSAAYPMLMRLVAPRLDLGVGRVMIVFIALQIMLTSVLPAIRAWRALPLTGWQLTVRLYALLAFIELTSLAVFHLVLLLLQSPQTDFLLRAVLLLPLSFALIPCALRFGPRITLAGGLIDYIFAQTFLFVRGSSREILACGIIALLASLLWLWWEIARGHHAYRIVPMIPMRWRGR